MLYQYGAIRAPSGSDPVKALQDLCFVNCCFSLDFHTAPPSPCGMFLIRLSKDR
jgi:hypothetical protein